MEEHSTMREKGGQDENAEEKGCFTILCLLILYLKKVLHLDLKPVC